MWAIKTPQELQLEGMLWFMKLANTSAVLMCIASAFLERLTQTLRPSLKMFSYSNPAQVYSPTLKFGKTFQMLNGYGVFHPTYES